MRVVLMAAMAFVAVCTSAHAKPRKVVDPLPMEVIDNLQVAAVEVIAEGKAAEALAKFDEKAARKAANDTQAPTAESVGKSKYSEISFAKMFPLVMTDVTREWGLTKGRQVTLRVTLDTIKTADAGMAMLLGSSDQLAGLVEVSDNETGTKLGSFYIDVLNSHSGMFGMMMRGGGIREKLAQEFALESSRILTGRKSKRQRS